MALDTTAYFASFDIGANTHVLDYSDLMFAALRQDPAILGCIRVGEETEDVIYRWVDDTLNAHQVTLGASAASNATTLTLSSGHGKRVRIGTLLVNRERAAAAPFVLQVTDKSTDTVTVALYAGTQASLASAAVLDITGNPLQEASDSQADVSTTRTQRTNATQIFERTVQISRNQMLRKMVAVSDEFTHQVGQRMFEIKRELNKAVIYGRANTTTGQGSDTQYRTLEGIDAWLALTGGNNVTTTATMSMAEINARSKDVWDDGGDPDLLVVSADLQQAVTKFDSASIRRTDSNTRRGHFVDYYLTDLGVPLMVKLDPYVVYSGGRGDFYILDTKRISLHPFKQSAFFVLSNPDNKDGKTARTIGEYTLRVSNPTEAHSRSTNVAA